MKTKITMLLAAALLLLTADSYGQKAKVAEPVLKHFNSTYPNAVVKEWDVEDDGSYEVEFRLDGVKWEAYYDAAGNWQKTERDVRRAEVPKAVWDALSKSEFAAWKIDDIEEHQTPKHKSVYEIEVKKGAQKNYVYILPSGEVVQ